MKSKIFYILSVLLALSAGCNDDFLYVDDPNGQIESDYFTDENSLEAVANGCFLSLMIDIYGMWGGYEYVKAVMSDEAVILPAGENLYSAGAVASFTASAGTGVFQSTWTKFYEGIHQAHLLVEQTEILKDKITPEKYAQFMGEGYFWRGYLYFNLVVNYGDRIPLYKQRVNSPKDMESKPADEGEVWAFIEDQLTKARDLLPVTGTTGIKGRPTKGAAAGALAIAYMFRYNLYDHNSSLDLAQAEFKKIIDGEYGSYRLMDKFSDNFSENTEFNEESLFEMTFTGKYEHPAGDWESRVSYGGYFPIAGGAASRWYNYAPSEDLVEEFEPLDPRKFMTVYCPGGAGYVKVFNNDTIYFNEAMDMYRVDGDTNLYYAFRKYETDRNDLPKQQMAGNNRRLIRLAEIYLYYAECLNEKGDVAGAATYVNRVRQRANNIIPEQPHLFYSNAYTGSIAPVDPVYRFIPSVEDLMTQKGWTMEQAIRHERIVEFGGEVKRWFDIIRYGAEYAEDALSDRSSFEYTKNRFWPIPQAELDLNPNMAGNDAN
jgi:hypothetical protein